MRRFTFMMPVFYSLLLSWLLALRLVVLHLLILLLVVRVVAFIVLTVVTMDMWRRSATGRTKLRKLKLVVLHRVLVVLVLEDLRGVLLVQRHRRFSCSFIALWLPH
jgi:hypothetical protein